MDLKRKGITWVGNMCQKFEAVCKEVDNIINQDTVKYVENQVNSASKSMKKLYSGVVEDSIPLSEAQAVDQSGSVTINAYFYSGTLNEENAANNDANLMDRHMSQQTSCKMTSASEEGAQGPNNSHLELNESIKENFTNGLLSGKSDGTLTDKHVFMKLDSADPLKLLRSVTERTDFAKKGATLACDNSDIQLEDEARLWKNDILTDKDANESSEKNAIVELGASDPLKCGPNHASCRVNFTNEETMLGFDDSHLPIFSKKSDAMIDEDLEESLKTDIMEPDANNPLKNFPSHTCSGTSFTNKDASLVSYDSHLFLESDVLSVKNDVAVMDEDSDESLKNNVVMEPLKNCPSYTCGGTSFRNKDASVVSNDSDFFLESDVLLVKNEDVLTGRDLDKCSIKDKIFEPDASSCLSCKNSNESMTNDAIVEQDLSYPVKNICISNSINYEKDVISASNDTLLNSRKRDEALIDQEADASFSVRAKLEFSTELVSFCDKESFKGPLYNESFDNECEKDILTLTGGLQETSLHSTTSDIQCAHKFRRVSSILDDNIVNSALKTETASDFFTYETNYSSNTPDATVSSEPLVLTSGEVVEETRSLSSLKSLLEESISASRNSVEIFCSGTVTVLHDNPIDQCVSDDFEIRPSFDVINSASGEYKALEMKPAPLRSSLLSLQSLEKHALKAHESGCFPDVRASSRGQCSESTCSKALISSSELGCPYNSSGYILESDMETIDLGGKVTLKDSCDIVDFKALQAVSRRTQKLRSYKKRIQDAFTSKKRLAKEYEQLAIWYGDTDLEFSTDSSQRLLFSGETLPDSKNAPSSYASDSEWEFL